VSISQRTHDTAPQDEADRGFIDSLMNPTWAEVDQAREQYSRDARRLRHWRWWLIGMFTFYTTLVGILLFELFTK
jgi:hypothetical protein